MNEDCDPLQGALTRFGTLDETRTSLKKLIRSGDGFLPTSANVIDLATLRRCCALETVQYEDLLTWLTIVETSYCCRLKLSYSVGSRVRFIIHGNEEAVRFATDVILSLDEAALRYCVRHLYGSPKDSEGPGFQPQLHLPRDPLQVDRSNLWAPDDMQVIEAALRSTGPHRPAGIPVVEYRAIFWPFTTLATRAWVPRVFLGQGDPQDALTSWHVQLCYEVVKVRLEMWIRDATTRSVEVEDAILGWLQDPSERNRIRAIALAQRTAYGHDRRAEAKRLESEPDATGYVANPIDVGAFVPMKEILTNHAKAPGLNEKVCKRIILDYPANHVRWTRPLNKAGLPMRIRLSVHLEDWLQCLDRRKALPVSPVDEDGFPNVSTAEVEAAKSLFRSSGRTRQ